MGRIADATWGRVFAAVYDRMAAGSEAAGMAGRKRQLLAGATGRTIELGAGTGLSLPHYPPAVSELVLTEPSPHMARRLREKVAAQRPDAEVVEAPAERLPFPDASFDTAVVLGVLCTVPDPRAALAEIARVLRPGGRALFMEHVRSSDSKVARRQDRLERPWRVLNHGCHPNRDTLAAIEASRFTLENVERFHMPKAPRIVREAVAGTATRKNSGST